MKRNEAAALGLVRYNTGRPCNKGHTSDRYTTGGMCIQCLSSMRASYKQARAEINGRLASGLSQVPVWAPEGMFAIYKNVAHILASSDAETTGSLISIIESLAGPTALKPTYPPVMCHRDIERYVKLNANREITNAEDFDFIDALDTLTDKRVTAVFMNGHWYDMADIELLIPRDSLHRAHPITPPEHLLPKTMKGIIV